MEPCHIDSEQMSLLRFVRDVPGYISNAARLNLYRKKLRESGFIQNESIECLTKNEQLLHRFVSLSECVNKLNFPLMVFEVVYFLLKRKVLVVFVGDIMMKQM